MTLKGFVMHGALLRHVDAASQLQANACAFMQDSAGSPRNILGLSLQASE